VPPTFAHVANQACSRSVLTCANHDRQCPYPQERQGKKTVESRRTAKCVPRCNADDEGENDRSLTASDIKPDRSTGTRCQIECRLIQIMAVTAMMMASGSKLNNPNNVVTTHRPPAMIDILEPI
jgi:hypothetical protein